jgi:hypothetical protein
MTRSVRLVLAVQGVFYVVTGIWPLVHMPSFELVTGPKIDHWLVNTVGLLLAAIGASLVTAVRLRQVHAATCVLAIGAALALAAIEIVYVTLRQISGVYLLDAAVEIALAFAIAWTLARARTAA